jgi:hypothetical protein
MVHAPPREPVRLREVPDIPRQQVAFDELAAELPPHPHEPRRRGGENRDEPDRPVNPTKKRPPARVAQPRNREKQADEDERDRPFRQHGKRQESVAWIGEAAAVSQRRDEQAADAAEQEQREHHVEQADAAQQERDWNRGEHERAPLADDGVEEHFAQPPGDADERNGGQRAGQPQRRLRLAKERDGERLHPVKENRLVDVGNAVQERHQPAAGVRHLPRELGVVRFVGIEQTRIAEPPEHHDPADERPAYGTQESSACRFRRGDDRRHVGGSDRGHQCLPGDFRL